MIKEQIKDGDFTISILDQEYNYREMIKKDGDESQYAEVLGMGTGVEEKMSYIAYNYLSDGNGMGDPLYCGSKGWYKTLKGARKKAKSYLTR